ncbi:ABC transporter ATP-binding protein [Parvularcula dongshanensis]|uniref:ABC-2 type transport system ATP-binding protein n=1 Tax=Parvularcula dongshanensis TaxID=1173995 RepID=A0A840I127_9PROT|nr:ABC transporter ATP-binding protein [Parvularcula dongshanensis]MBB4657983.1 ABC-2 type transport system ATP-binding protein [Parvularcula dongshanensis]
MSDTQTLPDRPAAETAKALDAAIVARGLRKVYKGNKKSGPKEALKGIDLTIPRGSVFGLLGPNGAGKSTFINILAGLVNKTEGEVQIWGFDIDKNPRQSRASIGVVPQELSTDVFFTPKEGLEIQAGLYGVPKAERRTMEILRSLGLEEKADSYVRFLSGGMKRRLLVAKAMVHDPPVLILDEPTAGVDIELRKQLWEQVMRLHDRGVTVILTTHYLEEAQELCDTIGIIHQGEVKTVKPKDELIASLDRKALTIVPETPLSAVPELGPLCGAELRGDTLYVSYRPSETRVADILSAVNEAGISVKDLSTVEADLEDVFLELTYGADDKVAAR